MTLGQALKLENYIKELNPHPIEENSPEFKLCIDDIIRRIKNMDPVVDNLTHCEKDLSMTSAELVTLPEQVAKELIPACKSVISGNKSSARISPVKSSMTDKQIPELSLEAILIGSSEVTAQNIVDLFKVAMKLKHKKILCWYCYYKAYENRVRNVKSKNDIDDKSARTLVFSLQHSRKKNIAAMPKKMTQGLLLRFEGWEATLSPEQFNLILILKFCHTKDDFTYDKSAEHTEITKFASYVAETTTDENWRKAALALSEDEKIKRRDWATLKQPPKRPGTVRLVMETLRPSDFPAPNLEQTKIQFAVDRYMMGNKAHLIADEAKLDYMSALDFPSALIAPPSDTSLTTLPPGNNPTTPPSGNDLTTPLSGNDPVTLLPPKQNILKRPQPLLDIYEIDLDWALWKLNAIINNIDIEQILLDLYKKCQKTRPKMKTSLNCGIIDLNNGVILEALGESIKLYFEEKIQIYKPRKVISEDVAKTLKKFNVTSLEDLGKVLSEVQIDYNSLNRDIVYVHRLFQKLFSDSMGKCILY
ncbi:5019_t:CDS:10 [Funneliformis mosseae]|uniref:5019_t:CDS:1 n=1 Tax=Funneliformis mosseae TaxID=27381 RepID=A0A9N9CMG9_FUNMO|nr:5019_t:CDS:10 [Funneliformis mosseae]